MKKTILVVSLVTSFALSLSACGSKSQLDGTYRGGGELTFMQNGRVSAVMFGAQFEVPYHINGDQINFRLPNGSEVGLTRMADGSLNSPVLGIFKKQ